MGSLPPGDLVLGVIGLITIGFLLRVPNYLATRNRMNRPLSVTHFTKETPSQVLLESRLASFRAFITIGGFLLVLWLILFRYNPDLAMSLAQGLFKIIASLLMVVAEVLRLMAVALDALV